MTWAGANMESGNGKPPVHSGPATESYLERPQRAQCDPANSDEPSPGRIANEIERELAESHRRCVTGAYDVTAVRNLYRDSKRELQEEGERMIAALRDWQAKGGR
jgi:hypothetical protein